MKTIYRYSHHFQLYTRKARHRLEEMTAFRMPGLDLVN